MFRQSLTQIAVSSGVVVMVAMGNGLWSSPALAVDAMANQSYPRPVPVGPLDLRAGLSIGHRYDDNIFFSDANRVASQISVVQPSLQLARKYREQEFGVGYALRNTTFWDDHRNDVLDHYFTGMANLIITSRNRLKLDALYTRNHYRIGTYFTQGLNDVGVIRRPDSYDAYTGNLEYLYGLPESKGNLGLTMRYYSIDFKNDLERTRLQSRRDITIIPSFLYRITPTAKAVLEFEQTRIDYDVPSDFGLNSSKQRYLMGMTWDPSAKLSGSIRFGYVNQELDNAERASTSNTTWDADLEWRIKTYSKLNLNLTRDFVPAFNNSGPRFAEIYSIAWQHNWRENLSTTIGTNYTKYNYVELDSRQDTVFVVNLGVEYRLGPGINVGLGYEHAERDSNAPGIAFSQNVIMLSVGTVSPWNSAIPEARYY